jgi:hypothetical protein
MLYQRYVLSITNPFPYFHTDCNSRPTPLYQTGVKSSSNQPTRSPITNWPSSAWRTFNLSYPRRRRGGTRESKESNPHS